MTRIKNIKLRDIVSIFTFLLALIPSLFFKIYLKLSNKTFWLLSEENEAHDNAYVFFEYLKKNKPEIKVYYAINSDSPDFEKVTTNYSQNIVSYGSFLHWIFYLNAEANISSQKGGKPNAAVCYCLEVFGLLKNYRVFLQHGITLNNPEFLHYKNTKISLFISGARPEYEFIKNNFGYPSSSVVYTGFPRFDNLHGHIPNPKHILLMPTWRAWLKLKGKDDEILKQERQNISESEYVLTYSKLLNDERLLKFLKEENITLFFYPHRNAQTLINNFQVKNLENIIICRDTDYDVQELLIDSSLLITDYSSVSMDFIYMKKNVIFFQFDEEKFRAYQYQKSYFDYEKTSLGYCTKTIDETVDSVVNIVKSNYLLKEEFYSEYDEFFQLNDTHNNHRVYKEIIQSLKNRRNRCR